MSKAAHPRLLSQIRSVIQQAMTLEKGRRLEIEGVRLHPSEIHVLLLVKGGRRTNVTRMAEILGVTKGAVSQTLTRLAKKGLLTKERNPKAKNELTLAFTALGRRAAQRSQRIQDRFQGRLDAYLSTTSGAARKAISTFLGELSAALEEAL